jgi:hypothetical protein
MVLPERPPCTWEKSPTTELKTGIHGSAKNSGTNENLKKNFNRKVKA